MLLQVGQVLDSMDGNLARYRNITTLRGGFLDRILDGLGFIFVMSSFHGMYIKTTMNLILFSARPMAAAFYLVVCYSYWTTAYQEQNLLGELK